MCVIVSLINHLGREGQMAEQTRYERYKDAIDRANRAYTADKHQLKVILSDAEYNELKGYCELNGKSMQGFIREIVFSAIRS